METDRDPSNSEASTGVEQNGGCLRYAERHSWGTK